LPSTRAVLNLDMIGRNEEHTAETKGRLAVPSDSTRTLNIVGGGYSPDLMKVLRSAAREAGLTLDTKYDRDVAINVMFRCDHFPFLAAGVPAVWLFGGFHPGYHEPVDTADRLDYGKLTRVTRLAFAAAWAVANSPGAPPRFRP
jgi:Zn-dependent M28 family amino/carboxypeptidase